MKAPCLRTGPFDEDDLQRWVWTLEDFMDYTDRLFLPDRSRRHVRGPFTRPPRPRGLVVDFPPVVSGAGACGGAAGLPWGPQGGGGSRDPQAIQTGE